MDKPPIMVYTVRTEIEPEYEVEFNEWQFEEHVPWLLTLPGYVSVRRFVDLGGPHRYMNLWQIESLEAHDCPEHHQKSVTPWSRRLKRYRKMQVNYYRHAFPAATAADNIACPEEPACMVIDRFDVPAGRDPDVCRWYEDIYIPQVVRIPGVIGVRGFELVKGAEKFMVLHYLGKDEADMGPKWLEWRVASRQKWGIPDHESYRPLSPTFFSDAAQHRCAPDPAADLAERDGRKMVPKERSMEADVVVLGAGGGGLMASIEAARAGAKVVLLESTSRIGGSSAISGGSIVFAGTDFQKECGIDDSGQLLYDDFMAIGRHRNVRELVRTDVDRQLETYARLKELGVVFKAVVLGEGSAPRTHRVNPAKMILLLKKEALRLGVEMMLSTPATGLIRNSGGRIVGVRADPGGGELTIGARKGVVVCTGGFSNNPEMLEDFKIGFSRARSFAAPGHLGDGLKMLLMEGARMKDAPSLKASYSTHPNSRPGKRQAVNTYRAGAILINKEGKRFVNEGLGHKELPEFVLKQPDGVAFELFDAKIAPDAAARTMQIKEGDLKRWALMGETLEELAGKAGIPAEALKETVAAYNRYAEAGRDPEFGRTGQVGGLGRLLKIDTPPFYMVEGIPAILGTYCGAQVNARAQVLNVSGEPIPGLYAAGEVMGGLHGDGYMSGTALGKALIFGLIAGKNVALEKGPAGC